MKTWIESQNEVRSVKKDFEMAKSILKMAEVRCKATEMLASKEFSSIKLEGYYEVIKEIITALMAVDGYKTLSHEVLIGYLKEFYKEFPEPEILLIDQVRSLRNKIAYKGFFIDDDYLQRNETKIKGIMDKLKNILQMKINDSKKNEEPKELQPNISGKGKTLKENGRDLND